MVDWRAPTEPDDVVYSTVVVVVAQGSGTFRTSLLFPRLRRFIYLVQRDSADVDELGNYTTTK